MPWLLKTASLRGKSVGYERVVVGFNYNDFRFRVSFDH
jgi:hypothetical protein